MTGHQPSYHPRAILGAFALATAAGCSNPLQRQTTGDLRDSIEQSTSRELAPAEARPQPEQLTRAPGEVDFPPERMEELAKMAGPTAYGAELPPLGPDLLNQAQAGAMFRIDLQQAVARAVSHNLGAQAARLDPAISEARVVAASAAFDWVFFANGRWDRVDEPLTTQVIGGVAVGVGANESQSVGYTTGIRKRTTSGGVVSIAQGLTYTDNKTSGASYFPDPSNRAILTLDIQQPLLRGAGSDVALAEVRLAENTERRSVQTLKATLIETITETERAYWRLVQAQRNLQILQRLVERGIETRDVLKSRLAFDVKPAEYSDAVATVERRRADVIRAINLLRLSSDRLKFLMNDPELTIGSETLLVAADDAIDQPISFSLLDSMTRALASRPEVQDAILNIDDASIRSTLADNARLPMLDMAFRATFNGLDADVDGAYGDVSEAQFVDFLLQLAFEQPIGNREAEANYRARQLERLRTVIAYRDVIRTVVFEVKAALRNLGTNYRLIEQTRSARLAAAENLRTLLVQEQTIQSLTPSFLDLKLRRQESLAQAEQDELAALIDYNIAMADYHQSLGDALERNRIRFVVPDAGEFIGAKRENR